MSVEIKIIAILRGIQPDEVLPIFEALISSGISMIEIPLNSPFALRSIRLAVDHFKDAAQIGAGTVLSKLDVINVADTGANFVVSPNCDPEIIKSTISHGLNSYPGILTPSEAFVAIKAGATGLKIFPAEVVGPEGIKAMKAVLPPEIPVFAVGGAAPNNFSNYIAAGCAGFGMGSYLYKPGYDVSEVKEKAQAVVSAILDLDNQG